MPGLQVSDIEHFVLPKNLQLELGEDRTAPLGRTCQDPEIPHSCGLGELDQCCPGWDGKFAEALPCSASFILLMLIVQGL